MADPFTYHPVTPERWPDLERLFSGSPREGSATPSQCWCMEWRRPRTEWEAGLGEGNRRAMEQHIASGNVPGLLAYAGDEPVAWCSISPRADLPSLEARGSFRYFANPAVWSVVCFYVREDYRGQGLVERLLRAAVRYAGQHGAKIVEGYPVDPTTMERSAQEQSLFMGFASSFEKAGFREYARGAGGRPVMRYRVAGS